MNKEERKQLRSLFCGVASITSRLQHGLRDDSISKEDVGHVLGGLFEMSVGLKNRTVSTAKVLDFSAEERWVKDILARLEELEELQLMLRGFGNGPRKTTRSGSCIGRKA